MLSMKHITVGMLAHVDAGKTTTAEAMLYQSGAIRTLGRVDHRDAYLDTGRIERQRGITIFSKQARFTLGELEVDLLDTPGHTDFSAEMERVLSVLDYAVLVISAPDGVQAHTLTLWSLLSRYRVPAFIWINKMDIAFSSREEILEDLSRHLGGTFVDFSGERDERFFEEIAASDEAALERYFEAQEKQDGNEPLSDDDIRLLIKKRRVFPCWFGSALKLSGTEPFLRGLERYVDPPEYGDRFGAKVFKITRDERGERLSWMKVTGGRLRVRDIIATSDEGDGEKLTQLRLYSGNRFTAADEVPAGSICAALGLSSTYAGQGLGAEPNSGTPMLEPVLSYTITLPQDVDVQTGLRKLSQLSEEDQMLRIVWNPQLKEIQARMMGEVQTEVLRQMVEDRFGMRIEIGEGRILYMETIASPVEGVGHFEPLRHYAEVHLLLEPLPAGSGIIYGSACSTDSLDLNWQRLILGNLSEKQHLGVLTGSPITDIRVTLVAGRAHLKHTEGGDFRQASWRAVRQGLMEARNVLLEPYYAFRLEVPQE